MSDTALDYALSDPVPYLAIDFGIAFVIGILVLCTLMASPDQRVPAPQSFAQAADSPSSFS